jgi:hypothetical protein
VSEGLSKNSLHLLLPAREEGKPDFLAGRGPPAVVIHKLVELEQRGMASRLGYLAMAVILGAAAFGARRVANNSVNGSGQEIQFEESPSEGVIVLRLNG